jgi:hypothetical protein
LRSASASRSGFTSSPCTGAKRPAAPDKRTEPCSGQSNGYNPNVLAIDPAGAESLDLLRSAGSEKFYLYGTGQGAPGGPFGLQLRVWKTAGTALLDADAFGRLYVAPMELRSFEADGGLTNKTNVRLETNAGYSVERLTAGLRIL